MLGIVLVSGWALSLGHKFSLATNKLFRAVVFMNVVSSTLFLRDNFIPKLACSTEIEIISLKLDEKTAFVLTPDCHPPSFPALPLCLTLSVTLACVSGALFKHL